MCSWIVDIVRTQAKHIPITIFVRMITHNLTHTRRWFVYNMCSVIEEFEVFFSDARKLDAHTHILHAPLHNRRRLIPNRERTQTHHERRVWRRRRRRQRRWRWRSKRSDETEWACVFYRVERCAINLQLPVDKWLLKCINGTSPSQVKSRAPADLMRHKCRNEHGIITQWHI